MKKRILSLILCLCLLTGVFVFSACEKDKGYDLQNLKTEYTALASGLRSISYSVGNKQFEFDYSSFVNTKGQHYLEEALELEPYKNLYNYNQVFKNMMSFTDTYIEACSKAPDVSKELRNTAKSNIDAIGEALKKIDMQLLTFERNISLNTGNDPTNRNYLQTFEHLLNAYNELYITSFDLTLTLSQIYYGYALVNDNINFSAITLENFTSRDVLINLDSRRKFEIAVLSYRYFEDNIDFLNLADKLTTKNEDGSFNNMGLAYSLYTMKVNAINEPISVILAENIDSNESLKTRFYNCSIELYNIQAVLDNDYQKFIKAFYGINYNSVKVAFNKTNYERFCVKVIEDYYYLYDQNYSALVKIMDII